MTNHIDVLMHDGLSAPRVLAKAVMADADFAGDQMPQRWQHSAVSLDGSLWLYGGLDRERGHPCGLMHTL